MERRIAVLAVIAAALLAVPGTAHAYIGPGAGITAIGTVIAFVGAIVFAIVGFVWYPVKRLLAAMRSKNSSQAAEAQKVS